MSILRYSNKLTTGTCRDSEKRSQRTLHSYFAAKGTPIQCHPDDKGQDADITTGISGRRRTGFLLASDDVQRKQTGSDRRKGKELQRNLINLQDTMNVKEMTRGFSESMLYGNAAGEEAISVPLGLTILLTR